jgi:hypothetical protein
LRLPLVRQKLVEPVARVRSKPADDVLEVVGNIEAMAFGALDETVEDRRRLATGFIAREQIIPATDDDR